MVTITSSVSQVRLSFWFEPSAVIQHKIWTHVRLTARRVPKVLSTSHVRFPLLVLFPNLVLCPQTAAETKTETESVAPAHWTAGRSPFGSIRLRAETLDSDCFGPCGWDFYGCVAVAKVQLNGKQCETAACAQVDQRSTVNWLPQFAWSTSWKLNTQS